MLKPRAADVLAKIAAATGAAVAERERRGLPGGAVGRRIGHGDGWSVSDVICTCGPGDRSFEEEHANYSIGVVLSGTFQYRSTIGRRVMTPGSLLLGNAGDRFECDHEHAVGDRCVAFHYSPAFVETTVSGMGGRPPRTPFRTPQLPPLKSLTRLVARAAVGLAGQSSASWDELAIEFLATALATDGRVAKHVEPRHAIVARVTDHVRSIELDPSADHTLSRLAADAGLTPFTYLRAFERLTGVTPHQFILRARMRLAATRLMTNDEKVIHIALDSGFDDVSNFNRTFGGEFGLTPTAFRARSATAGQP